MKWVNCGNCGRSSDVDALNDKRSKHQFGGATQYQKKCPFCHVVLSTSVPEDEEKQDVRIDPASLDEGVVTEMVRGKLGVKAGKAARIKLVREAAALKK